MAIWITELQIDRRTSQIVYHSTGAVVRDQWEVLFWPSNCLD